MKENGIVIFEDGTPLSFGKYVCPDQPEYLNAPGHEESFINEVISSFEFRLSNHKYHERDDFYNNTIRLSLEGLIIIINNKKSIDSENEILAYVPSNPTEEQISCLENLEQLKNQEIERIYEFNSFDFDDYIEYDSFVKYINSKHSVNVL